MRLRDATVVITGGGGGIGSAVARVLALEGAALVVADLDDSAEAAAAAARALGARAVAERADVLESRDMRALAARAVDEFGRLDVLVTCAGVGTSGLLSEQDEAAWTRVIDVNLNGTYRAIRAVLPTMQARGSGRIITVASVLGRIGGFGYVTAQGVIGLTRALAAELGSQGYPGITVNAICPGYVRAGMGIAMQSTKTGPMPGAAIFERWYKRLVPQRRMIEAEEIGRAAAFLASDGATGITGQALNVDGGFVMS